MIFEAYKLHHVGIVIPTFEQTQSLMELMGFREEFRGFVERWSCWCVFTSGASDTMIEFVVPQGGKLERFNKGGGGLHHLAFEVESLSEATRWAVRQGMNMVEPSAIKGAGNFWCNFLTPASTRGVQIEFVELIKDF
jgi:methylmalonyl-CoA/ethylmalonyl-CoA epimerase